ncbi:MAG: hypothetical protein KME06_17120 [Kastovskya adunca ATA6-11-RM4]|jgi:hypothetical protein|nr:hypothetical protein [Kastovskya adunca ATA6-11-RM4]
MAISTTVSSYELLVKALVQPEADILGAGRTIIQGYFLSISNLNTNSAVSLRLNFRAQTPDLNSLPVIAFWDINGVNEFLNPISAIATNRTYQVTVGAGDTGLFILQPDVRDRGIVENANFELRGYLTTSLSAPFGSTSYNLLLTPQQRGTFLPNGFRIPANPPRGTNRLDFDQLAYTLPTAMGGAQVTLSQIRFPNFPIGTIQIPELLELDPGLLQIIRENPNLLNLNGNNGVSAVGRSLENGAIAAQSESLQQVLSLMSERIEGIEKQISTASSTPSPIA